MRRAERLADQGPWCWDSCRYLAENGDADQTRLVYAIRDLSEENGDAEQRDRTKPIRSSEDRPICMLSEDVVDHCFDLGWS